MVTLGLPPFRSSHNNYRMVTVNYLIKNRKINKGTPFCLVPPNLFMSLASSWMNWYHSKDELVSAVTIPAVVHKNGILYYHPGAQRWHFVLPSRRTRMTFCITIPAHKDGILYYHPGAQGWHFVLPSRRTRMVFCIIIPAHKDDILYYHPGAQG